MILGETALSFLGLGLRPPVVSWAVLLNHARTPPTPTPPTDTRPRLPATEAAASVFESRVAANTP